MTTAWIVWLGLVAASSAVLEGVALRCGGTLSAHVWAWLGIRRAFKMEEDDDIVSFNRPEDETRERLLQACKACPVEALIVLDADGKQMVP